jgi:hypothetical protein
VGIGLKDQRRGTMSQGGRFVRLEDPASPFELELNFYPPGSRYATLYTVGAGLDHRGPVVPDARAMIERLRATSARVAVEPWHERGRYRTGFVGDPDGIWIEIQDPPEGSRALSAPSGSS